MTYAPPTIGPAGLTVPSYNDIYNYIIGQYQAIYGNAVYLGNDAADVQLISIFSSLAADAMSALQLEYNNRAPNFAIGAALDSLGSLINIQRKPASFSTAQLTVVGTAGAVITNGVVLDSTYGYRWDLPASVTIGIGGTVSVTATCETSGPVSVPAYTVPGTGISTIVTPTAGWISVSNPSPSVPGAAVETDSQFRTRYANSVALPSQTELNGTTAAIAATLGVTRYNVLENPTGSVDAYGNPAHSITAVVEGGANSDIANAIYYNRGLGCYTNPTGTGGAVTVNITDPTTGIVTPIGFARPAYVPIYVTINAHIISGVAATINANIVAAVSAYLNSLAIGEVVSYGQIVAAAASVNTNPSFPTVSIRSPLYIGTSPSPGASTDLPMNFYQVSQGVPANIVVNNP
jgi:uncharacterized phage protein gp47/JayE